MAKATKPVKAKTASQSPAPPKLRSVEIPHSVGVRQLAELLQVNSIDIIK